MNATLLGLLAETAIHPGAGSDTGFVDLPVAREAATDYPVIVGSSVKGSLLDRARSEGLDEAARNRVFGEQDNAGALVVSDARLLLLPVRSLNGGYKWITCPHLVERYLRDRQRAGFETTATDALEVKEKSFLGAGKQQEQLFLEERQFVRAGDLPGGLADLLRPLIRHEDTQKRLPDQLVVIHDDDFAWFARFGLAVTARNVLDDEKKTSRNLWYEETIPPDALFYLLLAERSRPGKNERAPLDEALHLFENKPYLQVGGNMTVGQGFFAVRQLHREGATA